MIKEIQVHSRCSAEGLDIQVPHAFISITDPFGPEANLRVNDKTLDVLRLQFHDVDQSIPGQVASEENGWIDTMPFMAIDPQDAGLIVMFIKELMGMEVDLLVVHCEAGRSRSMGVAAAISKMLYDDDFAYFKGGPPNMRCYRQVLSRWHR